MLSMQQISIRYEKTIIIIVICIRTKYVLLDTELTTVMTASKPVDSESLSLH